MSGRHPVARSSAAPFNGGADGVGVHAVDSLEALAELVLAAGLGCSALVLKLPHKLATSPALSHALRRWVQGGKTLPALALVVPLDCVSELRALAEELAHYGALLAAFISRDVSAALQYAEQQWLVMVGHAQQRAAAAARSDGAFMGFLSALLYGEAGGVGAVGGTRLSQRHQS